MSRTIVLDAGPLGLVTHPGGSEEADACRSWLLDAVLDGSTAVVVPEIADYEVRRELIRARRAAGIARLDALIARVHDIEYLALTTPAMRQAATFWAEARRQGRPTAADPALDGDVILAAQAATLDRTGVVVATTNVRHLSRFVPAELWPDIA